MRRSRGAAAEPHASYVALWTHLQKRYPRLRTILIIAASNRDDAASAATELALAASRAPTLTAGDRNGSSGHSPALEVADLVPQPIDPVAPAEATADADDDLELPTDAVSRSPGSVQVVEATPSGQPRTSAPHTAGDSGGVTIVVAPPPQKSSECITLASAADATILVATSGQTRTRDAREAAALLRLADVEIAAALLLSRGRSRRALTSAEAGITHVGTSSPASDGPLTPAGGRPTPTS